MSRIFTFIFLTTVSYFSFCDNDYQVALNKLKEVNDFFEKNALNDEQIKQVNLVIKSISKKIDSYKSEHYISENGALPLPAPLEILENSVEPKNDLVLTPNSKDKQNCVYTHIAEIGIKVPLEKRIDFKKVYKIVINKKFHWNRNISEKQLFEIMGIIEKKLIDIVFERLNLLKGVKYVGLAEDMLHRFRGHYSDLSNERKKVQNRKVKCHNQTLNQSNIEMSYLINNIPKEYHKVFEALVSTVFPAQLFYASALIADEAAWNFIIDYKKSDERKNHVKEEDIAKLEGCISYMNDYFNSINIENAYDENKENEKPVKKVELKKRKTSKNTKVPAYKKQKL